MKVDAWMHRSMSRERLGIFHKLTFPKILIHFTLKKVEIYCLRGRYC